MESTTENTWNLGLHRGYTGIREVVGERMRASLGTLVSLHIWVQFGGSQIKTRVVPAS